MQIFNLKANKNGWRIHPEMKAEDESKFFKENYKSFHSAGRDMETLLFHVKVVHTNRVLFEKKEEKLKISMLDIEMGMRRFKLHNEIKTEEIPAFVRHIYM